MIQHMNADLKSAREHHIRVEQIKILYQHTPPMLLANLIVSSAMLFGLWHVVPHLALTVWISLLYIILILRMSSVSLYRRNFTEADASRYGLYLIVGSGLSGFAMGIGAAVLLPVGQLEYQVFLLFIMVGMAAAAVSSLTIYLPAFLVYVPGIILPISLRLIFVGEPIQIALGVMTTTYFIAVNYFGNTINRSISQSLQLRFENLGLVEELRKQKSEAEQANISKTKFLAAASHDLRQPLHALTLFTSVLDESITYPKVRRVVDQIKSSVNALQSLFNALLDISRLDAGVMKAEKLDFELQPLLQKLANDYTPQASNKNLQIYWPTVAVSVHSDPTLLEQILRNYLSNAIRYTNTGEIRIACEQPDGQVTLHVSDTGVGIPVEEQQAIFEEFYQLGNPERDRGKGLGLGLAIVERSAKLLGHAIGVKSRPGQGSTFSITVDRSVPKSAASASGMLAEQVQRMENLLVMVIDDEISVLEGTQVLLETWGCQVITASDQAEALASLAKLDRIPDAIIADYRLRNNQTGIDAVKAIWNTARKNIPALIVTGDIAAEQLREVHDSGLQVLHKPVPPLKLRAFLRHIHSLT